MLFSSPPTASVGDTPAGSLTGSGAYPRERRIGCSPSAVIRTTESSQATWDPAVVGQERVGEIAEPGTGIASSVQIGSLERLPEVATIALGGVDTAPGTGVSSNSWMPK